MLRKGLYKVHGFPEYSDNVCTKYTASQNFRTAFVRQTRLDEIAGQGSSAGQSLPEFSDRVCLRDKASPNAPARFVQSTRPCFFSAPSQSFPAAGFSDSPIFNTLPLVENLGKERTISEILTKEGKENE
jgi:hypothetical protein